MGLALVRQTARRLGGTVDLAQDSGTVFTVELPLGTPDRGLRSPGDAERQERIDGHA